MCKKIFFRQALLYFLAPLFNFLICFICFSQNTESITITTYYPAPFGVYTNLRLFPSNQGICNTANNEGVLYYDRNSHSLRVCGIDAAGNIGWQNVGAWGRNGNAIFLNHNGGWQVGINTDSPQAALDVNGAIRIRGGVGACNTNTAGTIAWNPFLAIPQFCDGTRWEVMQGFGGAFTTGDYNTYGLAAPYRWIPANYLYPGSPAYGEWCETGNEQFPGPTGVPQCGCPRGYVARYAGTVIEGAPPAGTLPLYWDTIWVCTYNKPMS